MASYGSGTTRSFNDVRLVSAFVWRWLQDFSRHIWSPDEGLKGECCGVRRDMPISRWSCQYFPQILCPPLYFLLPALFVLSLGRLYARRSLPHPLSSTPRLFLAILTPSFTKTVWWAFSSLSIIAGERFSMLLADSEVQTANVEHPQSAEWCCEIWGSDSGLAKDLHLQTFRSIFVPYAQGPAWRWHVDKYVIVGVT